MVSSVVVMAARQEGFWSLARREVVLVITPGKMHDKGGAAKARPKGRSTLHEGLGKAVTGPPVRHTATPKTGS